MRPSTRLSLRFAAVALAAWVVAMDAASAQDNPRKYQIAEQSLDHALRELALASNLDLLFSPDLVAGKKSPSLDGKFTVDEALRTLLRGSGLEFSVSGSRVVISESKSAPTRQAIAPTTSAANGTNGYARLAQAETNSSAQDVRSESRNSERDSSSQDSAEAEKNRVELEEIIVVGTNIRGVYPSSSPVEIYTAEDIARTGATTTEQFIQKLPQNLGTRTQNASFSTAQPNRESVNGVDLRGLGAGTTLVLLNGRRLALASLGRTPDVSLIPMSAIERVEVLTDGASAIYGSEAIGGVVNFVLHDDFDGAETRINYGGVTSGSLRQGGFTQTLGGHWGTGRALGSYDFLSASSLEASDRSFVGPAAAPGFLTPDDRRHSILFTLSQEVTSRLSLDGDLIFSRRNIENKRAFNVATFPGIAEYRSETEQYFANLGLDYEISGSLNGSILASYSQIDVDTTSATRIPGFGLNLPAVIDSNHSALDLTAMLDGTIFELPAGNVRFSLGGGYLDEEYVGAQRNGALGGRNLGRTTTYLFGEVFAPLISAEQSVPAVHRLELSLAARYTNYDDGSDPSVNAEFGERTSPKIGLLWALTPSFQLRGTYGESFRAPTLTEIDPTSAVNFLRANRAVAGVSSTVLEISGPSPELDPEAGESYTFGFDFRPAGQGGLHLGATYFKIDYVDRIAIGDSTFGVAPRANPANFPDVIFRPSSAGQIEQLLRSTVNSLNETLVDLSNSQTASATLFGLADFWILDQRLRNLSLSQMDGLDLSISNTFTRSWGEVTAGAQLTRILDYRQQVTASAPALTVVDTVLLPVDLRGRAYFSFSRGGFDGTVSVNYVDDYTNPYAQGGAQKVESWTTLDLSVGYDFGRDRQQGFLSGVKLNLSVQNLFNRDPPFVALSTGAALLDPVGFDPANANPLGRIAVLGISKSWGRR